MTLFDLPIALTIKNPNQGMDTFGTDGTDEEIYHTAEKLNTNIHVFMTQRNEWQTFS